MLSLPTRKIDAIQYFWWVILRRSPLTDSRTIDELEQTAFDDQGNVIDEVAYSVLSQKLAELAYDQDGEVRCPEALEDMVWRLNGIRFIDLRQRDVESTWLVLQGDWGGQVYLTVPSSLLGPNAKPQGLLSEMDKYAWDCNEGDGASLFHVQVKHPQHGISGGMGGGRLTNGLWLHDEFLGHELGHGSRVAGVEEHWRQRVAELLDLTD
jgi:hypothetical protein